MTTLGLFMELSALGKIFVSWLQLFVHSACPSHRSLVLWVRIVTIHMDNVVVAVELLLNVHGQQLWSWSDGHLSLSLVICCVQEGHMTLFPLMSYLLLAKMYAELNTSFLLWLLLFLPHISDWKDIKVIDSLGNYGCHFSKECFLWK